MQRIPNLSEIEKLRRKLVLSNQPVVKTAGYALADTLKEIHRLQEIVQKLEQMNPGVEDSPNQIYLFPQMLEIVLSAARGETMRETARRLGLSEHTVKAHRCRTLKRLQVRSMSQAVYLCVSRGVITAPMVENHR